MLSAAEEKSVKAMMLFTSGESSGSPGALTVASSMTDIFLFTPGFAELPAGQDLNSNLAEATGVPTTLWTFRRSGRSRESVE